MHGSLRNNYSLNYLINKATNRHDINILYRYVVHVYITSVCSLHQVIVLWNTGMKHLYHAQVYIYVTYIVHVHTHTRTYTYMYCVLYRHGMDWYKDEVIIG